MSRPPRPFFSSLNRNNAQDRREEEEDNLDDDARNQQLYKTAVEVVTAVVAVDHAHVRQRVAERVCVVVVVVVAVKEGGGGDVADEDREVEECGNELQHVA